MVPTPNDRIVSSGCVVLPTTDEREISRRAVVFTPGDRAVGAQGGPGQPSANRLVKPTCAIGRNLSDHPEVLKVA